MISAVAIILKIKASTKPSLRSGGEVWVIFGTFGASDGFADIHREPKPLLTSFFVMIYTSLRWLEGRIGVKMRPRVAPQRTNFFYDFCHNFS